MKYITKWSTLLDILNTFSRIRYKIISNAYKLRVHYTNNNKFLNINSGVNYFVRIDSGIIYYTVLSLDIIVMHIYKHYFIIKVNLFLLNILYVRIYFMEWALFKTHVIYNNFLSLSPSRLSISVVHSTDNNDYMIFKYKS